MLRKYTFVGNKGSLLPKHQFGGLKLSHFLPFSYICKIMSIKRQCLVQHALIQGNITVDQKI